jgi:hypothetical protein
MLASGTKWLPPLLAAVILATASGRAWAQGGCAQGQCFVGQTQECGRCKHFCCPHTKHCMEGPPRICFQCGCGRPIMSPCSAPNWGYYQTCWSPWPWGPDWSHCPVQPPASLVWPPGPPVPETLPPNPNRMTPRLGVPSVLPSP